MASAEPEAESPAPPEPPAPGSADAGIRRSPALRPDGMNRPEFVLHFPEDPALDALVAAFEAGNYARVRVEAEKLAQRTEDPAIRDAALELRRRIDPDPLARYLLAISALLLVFLTVWAYGVSAH